MVTYHVPVLAKRSSVVGRRLWVLVRPADVAIARRSILLHRPVRLSPSPGLLVVRRQPLSDWSTRGATLTECANRAVAAASCCGRVSRKRRCKFVFVCLCLSVCLTSPSLFPLDLRDIN